MPTPVCIRGITYSSAKEAAKALNVHQNVVYAMLDRGRADHIGVGRGMSTAKPITVLGIDFESMRDAERQLGKAHGTIRNFMNGQCSPRVTTEIKKRVAEIKLAQQNESQ